MPLWFGIDIGGTKCAVVCAVRDTVGEFRILDKVRIPTAAHPTPQTMLPVLADAAERMCAAYCDVPCGFGISCGGPLDSRSGLILSPPNLPGWDNVPIVAYFCKRFSVPVFLQNDANACAVAEWKFGAGAGCRNMIFLTFGTGLGAGLILNGKLYAGTNDMAGEAGHIRLAESGPEGYGKAGSFEGFCSGGGIERMAKAMYREHMQRGGNTILRDDFSAKTVADAAQQGDALALRVYETCGAYLGRGLAILIDLLNPERIVIGSIFSRSAHLLREAMERTLQCEALPRSAGVCEIVPALLGEQIGDWAALGVLLSGLEESDD